MMIFRPTRPRHESHSGLRDIESVRRNLVGLARRPCRTPVGGSSAEADPRVGTGMAPDSTADHTI